VSGTLRTLLTWAAGNSLAGAVIGLAVAVFRGGPIESPTIVISVLFGNVVGFTALVSGTLLFPRLRPRTPALRTLLLGLALLTGSIVGSIAVLQLYPLFVVRDPRQAAAIVAINGVLALIVGAVVAGYEELRLRIEASLREVEQVRLVEARLREETARAELAALQARINPHFFFNTLNTIISLLDDDPVGAEAVLERLAALFRYTFEAAGAWAVTLREELEFVGGYLDIERARFGERLRVEWDVAGESLDAPVPGLVLQPIVENAVGHGIAPRAGGGTVRVRSRVDDGVLLLTVADDGVGLPPGVADGGGGGHGLDNVRRRLATLYGAGGSLRLGPGEDGHGTRVELRLPLGGPRAVMRKEERR